MITKYHISKNLFDKDNTTIYNAYFNDGGNWLYNNDSKSVKFPCLPNTEYTLSVPNEIAVFRIYESANPNLEPSISAGEYATQITRSNNIKQYTFTTSSTAQILVFQGSNGTVNEWFNGLMFNTGSTALPYEPYGNTWDRIPYRQYHLNATSLTSDEITTDGSNVVAILEGNMVQNGTPSPSSVIMPSECGDLESTGEHSGQYKIPIISGGVTTNAYLGEIASTRRIKKLVLTGEEEWDNAGNYKRLIIGDNGYAVINAGICSHLERATITTQTTDIGFNIANPSSLQKSIISIRIDNRGNDVETWLAQQYSAGTPVCVWYVLAEPTTGTVNEAIRKIGDYADSVTVTNIPTITGQNTFTVNTTLAPSDIKVSNWWETIGYEKIRKNNNWWINNSVGYWQQFAISEMQQKTIYELQGGD